MRLATCGIGPKDAGKCPATICIRSLQDLNASASLFAAAPSAKRLSIPLTQEKARPYAPSGIKKTPEGYGLMRIAQYTREPATA